MVFFFFVIFFSISFLSFFLVFYAGQSTPRPTKRSILSPACSFFPARARNRRFRWSSAPHAYTNALHKTNFTVENAEGA